MQTGIPATPECWRGPQRGCAARPPRGEVTKKSIRLVLVALLTAITFPGVLVAAPAAPVKAASTIPSQHAFFEAKEKAVWQSFKDKNAIGFEKLVSPKLVVVHDSGVNNLQDELDGMAKSQIKSITINQFTVVMTDPDTAILIYKAKIEMTCAGKDASGIRKCASIWRRDNGQWRNVFFSDR
ncbi:MAG: nuclear transport factor 2 family protein [Terriglobales bacterium]